MILETKKCPLRNIGLFALSLMATFLLFGCQNEGKKTLVLFTWADYLSPEAIASFEKSYNCRVVIDTFDSNEAMYAKLKSGAKNGYDIIFPTSYMAQVMHEQGWLQPLNQKMLPNKTHLNGDFLKVSQDPHCIHSLPYMITLTGVGYLADRVDVEDRSWAIFADERYRFRMTLLNDMREAIGAALLFEGADPNTRDLKSLAKAEKRLFQWRSNLAKFENEQYKMGLAGSEFLVSQAYLGDITKTQSENDRVQFYLPREGFIATCDDMVILNSSKNQTLAHAFADYLLMPEVAAKNAAHCKFLSPNLASLKYLDGQTADLHRQYLKPSVLQKAHFIRDLKEDNRLFIEIWDRVKNGKSRT